MAAVRCGHTHCRLVSVAGCYRGRSDGLLSGVGYVRADTSDNVCRDVAARGTGFSTISPRLQLGPRSGDHPARHLFRPRSELPLELGLAGGPKTCQLRFQIPIRKYTRCRNCRRRRGLQATPAVVPRLGNSALPSRRCSAYSSHPDVDCGRVMNRSPDDRIAAHRAPFSPQLL